MKRRRLTIAALEVIGAAALLIGLWLLSPIAALVVGGAGLLAIAILLEAGGVP